MIQWDDVDDYVEARDRVVEAAEAWVDECRSWRDAAPDVTLMEAVDALRSLYADRGVRDPSTPGQQETGTEQAHGEDPHD